MANVILNRHRVRPNDRVQRQEISEAQRLLKTANQHYPSRVEAAEKLLKGFGLKAKAKRELFDD